MKHASNDILNDWNLLLLRKPGPFPNTLRVVVVAVVEINTGSWLGGWWLVLLTGEQRNPFKGLLLLL